MFYRLERYQLKQLEVKPLVKSNGIYFELIIMSPMNPIVSGLLWLIIATIFGFPTAMEAPLLHILTMVILNILVFLGINYLTFRHFNGFYFDNNKIIRIKYNSLLQLKETEIIDIESLQYLKILHIGKGRIFQLSMINNDGLDRYFNGYRLNIKQLKKFCSEKNIDFEVVPISIGKFKELKKYID